MKVFKSSKEVVAAFKAYLEQVATETVAAMVTSAAEMIAQGYRNLPYPIQVGGEDVSKVPPAEIAEVVQANVSGLQGSIQINPSMVDEEWSARRYAALLVTGNPFASARQQIEMPQTIEKITGLKSRP